MGKKGIRIERVPIKDLCEFAGSAAAQHGGEGLNVLPLHRAQAYARNPYANDDDIGLLVAYMDTKPVGYLGIMPGQLRSAGEFSKVYWLTTWFVPEEYRDTSAGSLLMMTAISLRYDLLACAPDMGNEAQSVYRALGFRELGPLSFSKIEIERLNWSYVLLNNVQSKLTTSGASLPGLGRLTRASAGLFKPWRKRFYRRLLKSVRIGPSEALRATEVSGIDSSVVDERDASTPRFYRGREILRWMLTDKWVIDRTGSQNSGSNFFFSSIRDHFSYVPLKLSHGGNEGAGFVILSVSSNKGERTLKVVDYQISPGTSIRGLSQVILQQAERIEATRILLPPQLHETFAGIPLLTKILTTRNIYYFARPGRKDSMLATVVDDIRLDFCDGDLAFT